ncbi:MAG: nucleotide sugar dehydrogenase, partial [Deltaproteobacteria bacterium]|nr:nucleotide sugar dehydrogenase [Deltaproteobacteria bacterium]
MQLYDVCIIGGLGHMGLPLGLSLANTGKRVLLYDIDRKAMDIVSRGRMPFMELGAEEILCKVLGKTLFLSSEK